jgi:hypothetical protein
VNELAALTFTHQSSACVVASRLVRRRLAQKTGAPDDRGAGVLRERQKRLFRSTGPDPALTRILQRLVAILFAAIV